MKERRVFAKLTGTGPAPQNSGKITVLTDEHGDEEMTTGDQRRDELMRAGRMTKRSGSRQGKKQSKVIKWRKE